MSWSLILYAENKRNMNIKDGIVTGTDNQKDSNTLASFLISTTNLLPPYIM